MALPLVPSLRVPGVYQAMTAQAPQIPEAVVMHQHVSDTYIETSTMT